MKLPSQDTPVVITWNVQSGLVRPQSYRWTWKVLASPEGFATDYSMAIITSQPVDCPDIEQLPSPHYSAFFSFSPTRQSFVETFKSIDKIMFGDPQFGIGHQN